MGGEKCSLLVYFRGVCFLFVAWSEVYGTKNQVRVPCLKKLFSTRGGGKIIVDSRAADAARDLSQNYLNNFYGQGKGVCSRLQPLVLQELAAQHSLLTLSALVHCSPVTTC